MKICWITELLGTAPAKDIYDWPSVSVLDVRGLVDKAGNRHDLVKEIILSGVENLKNGIKTIVCCDYGISRSNAIAAGILSLFQQISFSDAVRFIQLKTGNAEIKLEPLEVVRCAIGDVRASRQSKVNRTVLVTGASGFVGEAVCKSLNTFCKVITPSREELDLERGAVTLGLLVADYDVDCIIHLANPRVYTSNMALGSSLTMLRNVLDVCSVYNISLIYPSSWEIYSGYVGSLLADENLPACAIGPYGDTKFLAEGLISQFQKKQLRCAILRTCPLYGLGSDKPKFIYNYIDKARRNETIVTHQYLNGDAALDLLHVDDFADAIARVYKKQYTGVLNFGTGVTISTKKIAELIKIYTESSSRIESVQIEANTAIIAMDYKKASVLLGWQPRVMFDAGLKTLL